MDRMRDFLYKRWSGEEGELNTSRVVGEAPSKVVKHNAGVMEEKKIREAGAGETHRNE